MVKTPAKYPIEVFWSEEDAGFIATVPDLPGCSAWGATQAEAIAETHDAIDAWRLLKLRIGLPSGRQAPQARGKWVARWVARRKRDCMESR
jgi:predicted RNase H-like HicB family nuclease